MGAQPKPRPGVASFSRQDLPLRAVVMLTCTVCSLLRASCLFLCLFVFYMEVKLCTLNIFKLLLISLIPYNYFIRVDPIPPKGVKSVIS